MAIVEHGYFACTFPDCTRDSCVCLRKLLQEDPSGFDAVDNKLKPAVYTGTWMSRFNTYRFSSPFPPAMRNILDLGSENKISVRQQLEYTPWVVEAAQIMLENGDTRYHIVRGPLTMLLIGCQNARTLGEQAEWAEIIAPLLAPLYPHADALSSMVQKMGSCSTVFSYFLFQHTYHSASINVMKDPEAIANKIATFALPLNYETLRPVAALLLPRRESPFSHQLLDKLSDAIFVSPVNKMIRYFSAPKHDTLMREQPEVRPLKRRRLE